MFDVTNKICTVGKWAEEALLSLARLPRISVFQEYEEEPNGYMLGLWGQFSTYVQVVPVFLRRKFSSCFDNSMPSVIRAVFVNLFIGHLAWVSLIRGLCVWMEKLPVAVGQALRIGKDTIPDFI